MAQLLVNLGKQMQGYTFRLQPLSRRWIVKQFPDVPRVASVFISVDTKKDFSTVHPNIMNQVFTLLTGLNQEELKTLDGLAVFDPRTSSNIYTYQRKDV
jgi:hypothetical protein